MKRLVIIFLILIIGTALIYLAFASFFPEAPPREASFEPVQEEIAKEQKAEYSAPDFALPDISGEKVKLSDFEGKIIVLTFWTTWNPAAQDQIVILESYFQQIKDNKDIILLTVNNLEDKSVVSNFIKRGEYLLPALLDEEGKVGELYKINSLPATFFINQQGKVKETFVGILNQEEIEKRVEGLYQK